MNKSLDKLQKKSFLSLARIADAIKKLKRSINKLFFPIRKAAFFATIAVYFFSKDFLSADSFPKMNSISLSDEDKNEAFDEMTIQALRQELADMHLQLQEYKCNLFSLNNPKDKEKICELEHLLVVKEKQFLELALKVKHYEEELALKNAKLGNADTITEAMASTIKAKNNVIEHQSKNYQKDLAALKSTALSDSLSHAELIDGYDALYRDLSNQNARLTTALEETNNQKEISQLLYEFNQIEKIQGFADFYEELQVSNIIAQSTWNELTELTKSNESAGYLHDFLLYDEYLVELQEDLLSKENALLAFKLYLTSRIQENANNAKQLQSSRIVELSMNEDLMSLSHELHQSYQKEFLNFIMPTIHDLSMHEELLSLIEENLRLKEDAMLALQLYSTAKFEEYSMNIEQIERAFFNELILNEGLISELRRKDRKIQQNMANYQQSHEFSTQLYHDELDYLHSELLNLIDKYHKEQEKTLVIGEKLALISQEKDLYKNQIKEFSSLGEEYEKVYAANLQLISQQEELAHLNDQNEYLDLINNSLQDKLESLTSVDEENKKLRFQSEELLSRIDQLSKTAEDYNLILSVNNQMLEKIEELTAFKQEAEHIRRDNSHLQAKVDSLSKIIDIDEQNLSKNNQLIFQIEELSKLLADNEQAIALNKLEMEKKDNRFSELNQKNEQLNSANTLLKEEIEYLTNVDEENNRIHGENLRLRDQVEMLSLSLQEKEQSLVFGAELIRTQELKTKELASESESIHAINVSLKNKIENLENVLTESQQLKEQIQILSQKVQDQDQLFTKSHQERKATDDFANQLAQENEQLKTQLNTLAQNQEELLTTSQQQRKTADEFANQLAHENEQLKTQLNTVSQKIQDQDELFIVSQQQIKASGEFANLLTHENEQLKAQLNTLSQKIQDQDELFVASQQQIKASDGFANHLTQENEQLKTQLSSLSLKIQDQDELFTLSQRERKAADEFANQLTQENKQLKIQLTTLSQTIQDQEDLFTASQQQRKTADEFANQLTQENEQLKVQLNSLSQKIQDHDELFTVSQQQRKAANEFANRLTQENEQLKVQLNTLSQKIQDQDKLFMVSQQQRKAADETANRLTQENEQLKKQMENLPLLAKENYVGKEETKKLPNKSTIPELKEASSAYSKFSRIAQQKNNVLKSKPNTAAQSTKMHTHVVQEGESLEEIAKKHYGLSSQWERIYRANQHLIDNRFQLMPGIILTIPN